MAAQKRASDLVGITMRDVITKADLSDEAVDDWLGDLGLLLNVVSCDNCGVGLHLNRSQKLFICNKRACRTRPTRITKRTKGGKVYQCFRAHMLFLVTIFVINMPYFHLVVNFNVKTGRKGVINSQSFWRVTAYSILLVASKKWGTTNGIVPFQSIEILVSLKKLHMWFNC